MAKRENNEEILAANQKLREQEQIMSDLKPNSPSAKKLANEIKTTENDLFTQLFDRNKDGVTQGEMEQMLKEMKVVQQKANASKTPNTLTPKQNMELVEADVVSTRPNIILHAANILKTADPKFDPTKATVTDLQNAMKKAGITVKINEAQRTEARNAAIDLLDSNRDGIINPTELKDGMIKARGVANADKDRNDRISPAELSAAGLEPSDRKTFMVTKQLRQTGVDLTGDITQIKKGLESLGVKFSDEPQKGPATEGKGKPQVGKGRQGGAGRGGDE